MMKKNNLTHASEFRQDPISGEWVLFAPERFHETRATLRIKKTKRIFPPSAKDIFHDPFRTVSEKIILRYAKGKRVIADTDLRARKQWDLVILENKYPAVSPGGQKITTGKKPVSIFPGKGHHDLLITRSDKKNFAHLSADAAFQVFEAFRDRYLMFFSDPAIAFVSIFHNWGIRAGASVPHPHYQILGIPLIPPSFEMHLKNSEKHFVRHQVCAHCTLLAWEKKEGKRIIAESASAIAFAPFASPTSFGVKIFPKNHRPFFENTSDVELADIAKLLQQVLRRMEKNLGDPDYNFYIHTAPVEQKGKYPFYHWHIEIIPRLSVAAGFEYATGIFINSVDPDFAAHILRG